MARQILLSIMLLTVAAVSAVFPQDAEPGDTIKVTTSLVSVPVIVSDRQGRYISGLTKEDFSVFVDGKAVETAFFASAEEPLRVAILVDTSRSTEGVLGKIKKAAREFVRVLGPNDSAMVVSFDYDVHINSGLTSDKKQLEKAIKDLDIGEIPGTVMRDAVLDTVDRHLSQASGRKAILLLTDGKDFGSYTYGAELSRTLEESDVMIYPIFYETSGLNRPFGGQNGPFGGRIGRNPRRQRNEDRIRRRDAAENDRAREILQRMADLTAGRFFEKKDNDLDEIFLSIASELRGQYRLGFYPDERKTTETYGVIKVRVTRSDVSVRARSSFRLKKD